MATQTREVANSWGTVGFEPSYAIGAGFAFGPGSPSMPPGVSGSTAGVPGPDAVAGGTASAPSAQKSAWAAAAAVRPWHGQPVFWSFALVVAGIFVLGNIAHVNVRSALR